MNKNFDYPYTSNHIPKSIKDFLNLKTISGLSFILGNIFIVLFFINNKFFPSITFKTSLLIIYTVAAIGFSLFLFCFMNFIYLLLPEAFYNTIKNKKDLIVICISNFALFYIFISILLFENYKITTILAVIILLCTIITIIFNFSRNTPIKNISVLFLFIIANYIVNLFLYLFYYSLLTMYIIEKDIFFYIKLAIIFLLLIFSYITSFLIYSSEETERKRNLKILMGFFSVSFFLLLNPFQSSPKIIMTTLGFSIKSANIIVDETTCQQINIYYPNTCKIYQNMGLLHNIELRSNIGNESLLVIKQESSERQYIIKKENILSIEIIKEKQ